jgi:hypothetical protein
MWRYLFKGWLSDTNHGQRIFWRLVRRFRLIEVDSGGKKKGNFC